MMAITEEPRQVKESVQSVEPIVELFHMVKSLIPEGQAVVVVTPQTTVAAAVEKMQAGDFSQLPVVSGYAVLGIFSYRSLARRLLDIGPIKADYRELPVDEFMEHFTFVQPTDKWVTILDILNREDGVLVGNRDDLRGILTSMDVLTYLHRIASPFVMLAEIEMSLRRIIEACVDEAALRECAVNSLAEKYPPARMPASLSDMSFGDYVQILGAKQNWPRFEQALGAGEWMRRETVSRLTEVRDLRNEVFHFKRALDESGHAALLWGRDWLEMKARAFEGQKHAASTRSAVDGSNETDVGGKSAQDKGKRAKRKKWTEAEFFRVLADNVEPEVVGIIQELYEWSRVVADRVWFGTGTVTGSFTFHYRREGKTMSVFTISTGGWITLNYGNLSKSVGGETTGQFHQRISEIPTFRRVRADFTKWPYLNLADAFSGSAAIEKFKQAVLWLRDQIDLNA